MKGMGIIIGWERFAFLAPWRPITTKDDWAQRWETNTYKSLIPNGCCSVINFHTHMLNTSIADGIDKMISTFQLTWLSYVPLLPTIKPMKTRRMAQSCSRTQETKQSQTCLHLSSCFRTRTSLTHNTLCIALNTHTSLPDPKYSHQHIIVNTNGQLSTIQLEHWTHTDRLKIKNELKQLMARRSFSHSTPAAHSMLFSISFGLHLWTTIHIIVSCVTKDLPHD